MPDSEKLKFFTKRGALYFIFFIISSAIHAQTNTWDGSSNSNWLNNANWSLGLVPTAAHDVVIPNGITANINVNTAAVCRSFTINGGGTANTVSISAGNSLSVTNGITIGAGNGNGDHKLLAVGTGSLSCSSITVTATGGANRNSGITLSSGTVTVTGNITMGANDVFTFSNSGTLYCGGTFSGGAFTASTGTVNYNGTVDRNISPYSYNNLTFSGLSTKTLTANTTVGGNLTLQTGTVLNLATFTANRSSAGGTLSIDGTSTLLIGGTGTFPSNYSTTTLSAGSTVNYTGINQNIAGLNYSNLTLSGSGTKTLLGNTVIGGTLTLDAAFAIGGNTITLNGPAIAGTPTNLNTTAASSLIFGGTSAGLSIPSSVSNLNNLTINNANGITMTGNVTVSNNIALTQGIVNTGSYTLSLSNGAAGSLTRASGYIIGKLKRTVNAISGDYVFPIGTSDYRPAIMNFSTLAAGTDITAEFIASPPTGFTGYTDGLSYLNDAFTEGYWRFISSGLPASTYTITLSGTGFTSYLINGYSRITGRDNGNNTWRALGTHGSQSGSDLTRTDVSILNNTFDFAFANGCSASSMGYGFERNITIDHTMVSGGDDLKSFPVLINLNAQDFLKTSPAGQILNPSGYDIIFTDGNYNKLDHQLEYYNGTNGDLIAWVRIPVLSVSANTIIKILYGNPQIAIDQSTTDVWDSHYKGVWHFDNNSLGEFTSYSNPGTPYNSPTYPGGRIYNSMGLNGTNEYAEVLNASELNFAGNITVSAWVYMGAGNRDQKIASNQNNSSGGYKFGVYTNNKVEFEIRNSANTPSLNRDVAGGTTLNTGQWYYLAGISSDVLDSINTVVNGIPERPFKKTGILGIADDKLTISKEPFENNYYFNGRFDELRISDEVRSNGWLRTEFNNQSSPSTFYSVDAEAPSNNLPSASICNGPITLTFGFPSGGTYSGNPNIVGNVFTPSSAGTYPIIYTYIGACGPTSVTKNFIITDTPSAPAASDQGYCVSEITYLEATGENIKWYKDGLPVSTANPFSTGQVVPGTYDYTVTQTLNDCESPATSVRLTIYNGITITAQPQPALTCTGSNATFSITAAGYNLSYRWQEDGVNITNGGIYSGATTSTLTLTNPGIAKNGKLYRCVVTSACGASSLNSNTALLTVNPLPVATFSYTGTPYCPNAANPSPVFSGGGIAGTFTSTSGLVFVSSATGQINISASTPGSYIVTNTVTTPGCGDVIATSPFTIISNFVWNGSVSTNWFTPANWSCGVVPVSATSVAIPDVVNEPVIGTGAAASINNLTIDAGSSLTVSGNTIQISGTITNNGTFDVTNGAVEMNGSAPQVIGPGSFAGNTIRDLTINNSAGVTLTGPLNVTGIVLISTGSLSSAGNLTLVSTATGTALIDGSGTGTVTGNVTMQRYLPSVFGYRYFSSPFQTATVNEFADDMLLDPFTFFKYDENRTSSGWVDYDNPPTNPLVPVQGYAINFGDITATGTVDITGAVNDGNLSVTLFNHNYTYTKGFNLVGNPYPSSINWNAPGWTKTNIDNAIYCFNASTTDQYGGTYNSYVNGVSSNGIVDNIIPSMQGFLVHVSDGAWPVTGTLALNNSVRITNLNHAFAKSMVSYPVPMLRLKTGFDDDPASTDPAIIYFDEKATGDFDSELDALKLLNTDFNVANLYTISPDGSKLSISALPPLSTEFLQIPLGVKLNREGSVFFMISDIDESLAGLRVYISDVVTGINQDLLPDKEYRLSLGTGEYNNRFYLNFSNITTGSDDDIIVKDDLFRIWSSNGKVKADINILEGKGILKIYNLMGQVLYISTIYQKGYHEFEPGLTEGIYIVKYTSGSRIITRKIHIQNK